MNRIELKEFLDKELLSINPKRITIHLKEKFSSYYHKIIEETSYLPFSVKYTERIHHILHDLQQRPKCKCGNDLHFLGLNVGYTRHCSRKCVPSAENTKNWFTTINKKEFGRKVSKSLRKRTKSEWNETREKQKHTKIKKYGNKYEHTYEEIVQFFKNNNCELLETEFINIHVKMKYRCSCGNITFINFNDFRNGHRCMKCGSKKRSGEKNGNWNPEMTNEDRNEKKQWDRGNERKIWIKSVFQRDKYLCQVCHRRKPHLNVHHILNWKTHKELRTTINNGITMCVDCHKEFHMKYGKRDNNIEQVNEFKLGVN